MGLGRLIVDLCKYGLDLLLRGVWGCCVFRIVGCRIENRGAILMFKKIISY